MSKPTIKSQHTASYSQLNELLSVAANVDKSIIQKLGTKANASTVATKVTNDQSYKAMRQLVCNWLLPEWHALADGDVYAKDSLVRCNGWVFKALADTDECPYTVLGTEDGLPIVNADYQLIITENVNEGNWANMAEAPALSIEEIMARAQMVPSLIERLDAQAARIEALEALVAPLNNKTIIIQS